jgi:hypothetical protein
MTFALTYRNGHAVSQCRFKGPRIAPGFAYANSANPEINPNRGEMGALLWRKSVILFPGRDCVIWFSDRPPVAASRR